MRSLGFPLCDIIFCKIRNRRQEVPSGKRQKMLAIYSHGQEVKRLG